MSITVTLNGQTEHYEAGTTVDTLVVRKGWCEQTVAVAVDGIIVPRSRWREASIPSGADITVLSPMQGG